MVGIGDGGLEYLEMCYLQLADGQRFAQETGGQEVVLCILGSTCNVECSGGKWENIGQRKDVFSGLPTAIYVPCGSNYATRDVRGADIVICRALSDKPGWPTLVL